MLPLRAAGLSKRATHSSPNVFVVPAGSSELSEPKNARPWLSHAITGSPALAVRICASAAYGEVSSGIARDERADEARAAVLRAVVAEPDRADGVPVGDAAVVDAAVVVRAAEQDARVARIDRDGGLVLAAARDRALVERRVGVWVAGRERVGADIAAVRPVVVREPRVGRIGLEGCNRADHGGCDKRARGSNAQM